MRSLASFAVAVAPLAVLATLTLGGCKSDPYDVSFDAIKRNPSPELMTLNERAIDVDRNMHITRDQNLRAMWNDLGRVFLTDHPSALSPYNVYATSGQRR